MTISPRKKKISPLVEDVGGELVATDCDGFRCSTCIANAPLLSPEEWMKHVKDEESRRDWIAAMRWADAAYKVDMAILPLSPLHAAARDGDLDAIRTSLAAGSHPDGKSGGLTALMLAVTHGHNLAVKLLLDYGADPDVMTETTEATALGLALLAGHVEIAEMLEQAGAKPLLVLPDHSEYAFARASVLAGQCWEDAHTMLNSAERKLGPITNRSPIDRPVENITEAPHPTGKVHTLPTIKRLLDLALIRVELLTWESRLQEASETAEEILTIIASHPLGKHRDLMALMAHLGRQAVVARLRRGEYSQAEDLFHAAETASDSSDMSADTHGWLAMMAADLALHCGMRLQLKRAARRLAAVPSVIAEGLKAEMFGTSGVLASWLGPANRAKPYFHSAIEILSRAGDHTRAALWRIELARSVFNCGDENSARDYVMEAEKIFTEHRSRRLKAVLVIEKGYQQGFVSMHRAAEQLHSLQDELPSEERVLERRLISEFAKGLSFQDRIHRLEKVVQLGFDYNQVGRMLYDLPLLINSCGQDLEKFPPAILARMGGDVVTGSLRLARQAGPTLCVSHLLRSIALVVPGCRQDLLLRSYRISCALEVWGGAASDQCALAQVRLGQWLKDKQNDSLLVKAESHLDTAITTLVAHCASKAFLPYYYRERARIRYLSRQLSDAVRDAQDAAEIASVVGKHDQQVSALFFGAVLRYHDHQLSDAADSMRAAVTTWRKLQEEVSGSNANVREMKKVHTEIVDDIFPDIGIRNEYAWLDMLEEIRRRHTANEPIQDIEMALLNDGIWLVCKDFERTLGFPEREDANEINDLWYVLSQVRGMKLPNALRGWEMLIDATQDRDDKRIPCFHAGLVELQRLLD